VSSSVTATNSDIFADRRRRFLNLIGPGSIAIMPSAPVALRSGDVEFIYRQDNDFYYLTGFAEPDSVALFDPDAVDQFTLFVRPRDKERETWTGRRAGLEGVVADFGANRAYPIDELDAVLRRHLDKVDRVFYPLGGNERMNARILELLRGRRRCARGSALDRMRCSIPANSSTRSACASVPKS
jgi:Xaa-Pro aminopeptidase